MAQEKNNIEIPGNAFLIVNGAEVFPLKKSIVTIGRMEDNDLVIQEVRISRYHAQLRAVKGQYILVDLQSTGGTSVNGSKVQQVTLYPGDVISFAGIPVIFGQNPFADLVEDEKPDVRTRFKRTEQPTKAITDSVELSNIDHYLEMFDDPTEHE